MTIPRLKSVDVSEKEPNSVILQLNTHKFKLNGYQVHALRGVLEELSVECQSGLPGDHGVEISGISR